MRKKIKIGDLVRYNAGGMRDKTLGFVFDINKSASYAFTGSADMVLIQWCMVGKWMPRRASVAGWTFTISTEPPRPGEICWHQLGDWFEALE